MVGVIGRGQGGLVTGAKSDGFYEVRSGLEPGESVVAEANFLVDSESRLRSALSTLNGSAQ